MLNVLIHSDVSTTIETTYSQGIVSNLHMNSSTIKFNDDMVSSYSYMTPGFTYEYERIKRNSK